MDIILEKRPGRHIFNVGNKDTVSIRRWVELCYNIAGKQAEFVNVYADIEQRNYFCFYNYEYCLDVSKQYELMPEVKPMYEGLKGLMHGTQTMKVWFIKRSTWIILIVI